MRKYALINTQKIRAKLIIELQGLFNLAISVAKGKVKRLRDDDGKEYCVTPQQRQKWARIAAYTTQIVVSVTKEIDRRYIDKDFGELECLHFLT